MIRARLVLLLALSGLLSLRLTSAQAPPPQRERTSHADRSEYTGDQSCLACHKNLSQTYQRTSHHLTSQLPTQTSLLGSFRDGANELTIIDPARTTAEPGLKFKMEAKEEGFFETAMSGWGSSLQQRSERIELITGSGVRGQTYLYWQGDRLFELPVSYWADGHQWINSPGYIDGTADFSRPVNPGCLECHTTYIRALSTDPLTNRYDRESLVPGISCESCHGPGARHIAQQTAHMTNSKTSVDQGILNPAKFSRDRQVDLCAECHNGIQREGLAPAFSYTPGRPLNDYFKPLPTTSAEHPDVHGNQVGLLERSKCYLSSPNMSCSTCHDVHASEQPTASYSAKCLGCHQWQSCGVAKQMGHKIVNNCIDCHMPVEPTNVIVSQTADKMVRAKMRNHWIRVYPDARLPQGTATAVHP
jgi:hypothetical protein